MVNIDIFRGQMCSIKLPIKYVVCVYMSASVCVCTCVSVYVYVHACLSVSVYM